MNSKLGQYIEDPAVRGVIEKLIEEGILESHRSDLGEIGFRIQAEPKPFSLFGEEYSKIDDMSSTIFVPLPQLISLVRKALKHGESRMESDTLLADEIDFDTFPPDTYNYHPSERRCRAYRRLDKIILKVADDQPRLSVSFIKFYITPWKFELVPTLRIGEDGSIDFLKGDVISFYDKLCGGTLWSFGSKL